MKPASKDFILTQIPLFADLSAAERVLIRQRSTVQGYRKGELIYREGDAPDAFYCLLQGRAMIYTTDQHGGNTVLEYLHHGKYCGIISLLTNEPHSVSVEALSDCMFMVIKKKDFDLILRRIPRLAIDLSQTLSRRLKRKDIHQKTIFESTVISVFSSHSQAGKTVYALNLSLSLKKETQKSVLVIDIAPAGLIHSMPQRLGVASAPVMELGGFFPEKPGCLREFIVCGRSNLDLLCLHYAAEDDSCLSKLVAMLGILVNDYHYIILDMPSLLDRFIFSVLNQSDFIHILSSPEEVDLRKTRRLSRRLEREFNFRPEKIKFIINEYKLAKITYAQETQLLGRRIFATLPKIDFESSGCPVLDEPLCEYAKALRRISRDVGECLVGLVLGVGVGYGFCHIGVLKVIEEEKIPIDVIAGSSVGALIASLWASGYSSAQILAITEEFKEQGSVWSLVDFTFPLLGFIKGNKLHRFLKKYLGNKTFYDLKLPLKVIASDVRRKEPRVFDKGALVDAIMASCTMPGVFAPFKFKDELLFDGGVTNPLPTEALLKSGVKKIIAVNVTPSREDILRQFEAIKKEMTVSVPEKIRKRQWLSLREYLRNIFRMNILNIIFSSIEILQSEVAEREAQLADVVLHPDTSGMFWLELHRAREFAHRGEEEARRHLDKIRQIASE